jgi:hypothetical protein
VLTSQASENGTVLPKLSNICLWDTFPRGKKTKNSLPFYDSIMTKSHVQQQKRHNGLSRFRQRILFMRKIHIRSSLAEQIGKNRKFPKHGLFAKYTLFRGMAGTYIVELAAFDD